ncbi:hypothetical protein SAMN04488018_102213 [Myroides marinus]|uniref:DUF1963 domain-containing protein n=1 Tax=Myroides marinus TaxID=703342 RepID=A0A1H6S7N6_9FLAO|nr:hypothetical protein [Myroides marinus]SEI60777.1 hypothetical protein SAMN04488018_102213 [Myroides marinus]
MEEKFAECIPYDNSIKGRIGGNVPGIIENDIPEGYVFYATIVHPDMEDKMLSILIYEDFEILLDKSIYPDIAVRVIEHDYSTMSNKQSGIKDLGICSISEYTSKRMDEEEAILIKCYGAPDLIQEESFYIEPLEKDNYSFYLMIDEDGYNTEILGDYVFMYGALYLYKHNETGKVIAGYWQCS